MRRTIGAEMCGIQVGRERRRRSVRRRKRRMEKWTKEMERDVDMLIKGEESHPACDSGCNVSGGLS